LRSSADCADDLGDFEWISLCGPTCTRYIGGADKFPSSLMASRPVLRIAAVNDDPIEYIFRAVGELKAIAIIPSDSPFIHKIKLIFQLADECAGLSCP
jgi:hypothetical protein